MMPISVPGHCNPVSYRSSVAPVQGHRITARVGGEILRRRPPPQRPAQRSGAHRSGVPAARQTGARPLSIGHELRIPSAPVCAAASALRPAMPGARGASGRDRCIRNHVRLTNRRWPPAAPRFRRVRDGELRSAAVQPLNQIKAPVVIFALLSEFCRRRASPPKIRLLAAFPALSPTP